MSYKQSKWLILIIPTLTIGIWEYVRHEYLLYYISMDLGNILSPIIVFLVTILFLTRLFSFMERNQEELNEAKGMQAVLLEREKIAAELHDGIAQSLFLLNVQIEQAQQYKDEEHYIKLKTNLHKTNAYVREAITSLRSPLHTNTFSWTESLKQFMDELQDETELDIEADWKIVENYIPLKEKIDLLLSVREALLNVKKHAQATVIQIDAYPTKSGWYCSVKDNGTGMDLQAFNRTHQFGLKMIQERAKRWNWRFDIVTDDEFTIFQIQKTFESS